MQPKNVQNSLRNKCARKPAMVLQEPLATDTDKQKRGPQTRAIPSFNRVKYPVFLWRGAT